MAHEFGDPLPPGTQVIEVHVGEVNQLFNAMDPAPFRERDLDPKAEEFVVEWAKELHLDRPLALVVHLDREAGTPEAATVLKDAVHQFFKNRARATEWKLRQLFRNGRISLLIGLVCVAVTVIVGDVVANLLEPSRYASIARESLLIAGWVAMWRPIEVFLYDWWPIRADVRLYRRLSEMPVKLVQSRPSIDGPRSI